MSGLLVDTHIVLSSANGDLSPSLLQRLEDEPSTLYVSVATLWEIGIKIGLGKLNLEMDARELVDLLKSHSGIEIMTISEEDVQAYAELPFPDPNHRDHFDRMLVVQAMRRGLSLLTSDPKLGIYGKFVETA